MPGTTPFADLPYPLYTDPADPPTQLQALAETLDALYTDQAADIVLINSKPRASISSSTAVSTANGAATVLTFDTEDFDNDGMADIPAHPTSLIPQSIGFFLVTAYVVWSGNANGDRQALLRRNGTVIAGQKIAADPGGVTSRISVTAMTSVFAGDVLDVQVTQTTGAALNVTNRNLQAMRIVGN